MYLANILSHSVGCCFVGMIVTLAMHNFFFMRIPLFIVDLSACANGVLFRVPGFKFTSLIHMELSFVQSSKFWIYLDSFTCTHPV